MTSPPSISGVSQSHTFGNGLSGDEAHRRLAEFGPNEPAPVQRATVVKQLLLLFANPLVIILLIASLVSAMIGDVVNASIIIAIVLLSRSPNTTLSARGHGSASGRGAAAGCRTAAPPARPPPSTPAGWRVR